MCRAAMRVMAYDGTPRVYRRPSHETVEAAPLLSFAKGLFSITVRQTTHAARRNG